MDANVVHVAAGNVTRLFVFVPGPVDEKTRDEVAKLITGQWGKGCPPIIVLSERTRVCLVAPPSRPERPRAAEQPRLTLRG